MNRKRTEEELRRAAETHAAKMERRQEVRYSFKVGPDMLHAFWLDSENWAVQKNDDESDRRYYPNLANCLLYILHQKIGEKKHREITDVLTAVRQAEALILAAVRQ